MYSKSSLSNIKNNASTTMDHVLTNENLANILPRGIKMQEQCNASI